MKVLYQITSVVAVDTSMSKDLVLAFLQTDPHWAVEADCIEEVSRTVSELTEATCPTYQSGAPSWCGDCLGEFEMCSNCQRRVLPED